MPNGFGLLEAAEAFKGVRASPEVALRIVLAIQQQEQLQQQQRERRETLKRERAREESFGSAFQSLVASGARVDRETGQLVAGTAKGAATQDEIRQGLATIFSSTRPDQLAAVMQAIQLVTPLAEKVKEPSAEPGDGAVGEAGGFEELSQALSERGLIGALAERGAEAAERDPLELIPGAGASGLISRGLAGALGGQAGRDILEQTPGLAEFGQLAFSPFGAVAAPTAGIIGGLRSLLSGAGGAGGAPPAGAIPAGQQIPTGPPGLIPQAALQAPGGVPPQGALQALGAQAPPTGGQLGLDELLELIRQHPR